MKGAWNGRSRGNIGVKNKRSYDGIPQIKNTGGVYKWKGGVLKPIQTEKGNRGKKRDRQSWTGKADPAPFRLGPNVLH